MYRKRRTGDMGGTSAELPTQGSDAAASLPQRIGESASGLLRDFHELRSPRAAIGVLASLNTANAKAESSFSSTGTGETPLVFRSTSQYERATLNPNDSFHFSEQGGKFGRTYSQAAFNDFLAGQNNVEHEPGLAQTYPVLSGDQQGGFSVGLAEDDLPQVQERKTWEMREENHHSTDRDTDGSAVVALLSDPKFAVDETPSSTLDLKRDGAEWRSHESLQIGQGPAEVANVLHPSNPLDFIPHFGAPWNPSHAFSASPRGIHERGHFPELEFGEVQPWMDILYRYHDEVWGEMLPLVQDAREELTNEKQDYLGVGPAIRRLKMVLQHLGEPNYR